SSVMEREFLWYLPEDTDDARRIVNAESVFGVIPPLTDVALRDGKVAIVMFRTKRLVCHVRALWIQDSLGTRRLRVLLCFTVNSTHWANISLNYRTRPNRGKMPKFIKKQFFPYDDKRVYIPEGNGQYQSEEVWVNDAFVIISLYLLQERFVDLD